MRTIQNIRWIVLFLGLFFLSYSSLEAREVPVIQEADQGINAKDKVEAQKTPNWIWEILNREAPQKVNPDYLIPVRNPGDLGGTVIPGGTTPTLPDPTSCAESLQRPGTLEARLAFCSEITSQIIWETASGYQVAYHDWTSYQKNRLNDFFQKMMSRETDLGMTLPNVRNNKSFQRNRMFLTAQEASDIYLAHLAHVFYLEVTHRVPWSILSLPQDELAELVASSRYHQRILPSLSVSNADYPPHIRPGRDFQFMERANHSEAGGIGLLGDPRDGYNYLTGRNSTLSYNLLGSTEEETLQNLTLWIAQNLVHGYNLRSAPENTIDYYSEHQSLRDRLKREERRSATGEPIYGIFSPMGCHTTANLFHDLARSVNIPIKNIFYYEGFSDDPAVTRLNSITLLSPHQGLVFRWQRENSRILYHTDELYAKDLYPVFPVHEDGTRLSQEQTKQFFFDVHWMSPTTLRNYGYEIPSDFSLRTRSELESEPHRSFFSRFLSFTDNSDFGVFGGRWIDSPSGKRLLSLEKQRLLCSARGSSLLSGLMTSGNQQLEHEINRLLSMITVSPAMTQRPLSMEEYSGQIQNCLDAYGATLVRGTLDSYFMGRGANQWSH